MVEADCFIYNESCQNINISHVTEALDKHGYNLLELIGTGGFAAAYKIHSRKFNIEFVVKVIDLKLRTPERQTKTFEAELNALVNLCHPNVISVYDHFQSDNALFIVLEYCPGGNLFDFIKVNGRFSPSSYIPMFRQLLNALSYCHNVGIVHRDIKPSNVFLDKYNRPKLADFGLSDVLTPERVFCGMTGSRAFLAPEIWTKHSFDAKKADIWAMGVTFFIMTTRRFPWEAKSLAMLEKAIEKAEFRFDENTDEKLVILIRSMLTPDPRKRPSIETLLKSKFFSEISTNSVGEIVSNGLSKSSSIIPIIASNRPKIMTPIQDLTHSRKYVPQIVIHKSNSPMIKPYIPVSNGGQYSPNIGRSIIKVKNS